MLIILITFLIFFVTLFAYFYAHLKKSRRYFRDAGIPYIEPHWLLGNMKDGALLKKAFVVELRELYQKLEPHRFAGIFNLFQKKSIMIRDPELIKRILIKDFSYFPDHGIPAINKETDPEWANNLFTMEGDEWKNLRIKLTGTFTSGKMKIMFPLMKKCAQGIKPALMQHVSDIDGVEMKDFSARYTTDVIGNCAFGIDTNSLKNPDSEFRIMGKRLFEFRWRAAVRFIIPKIPTWIIKTFKMHSFNKDAVDYFSKSVENMIKYREENNIVRGDFLDLLIAMKNRTDKEKLKADQQETEDLAKFMVQVGEQFASKKNDVEMTVELMAAQCFVFIIGGFENTSVTLSLLLFELASNPEIQNKVREEIVSTIESNGDEVTYDLIKNMPYLNMALKETLRKYGVGGAILMRKCNENYKIPDSDVVIKKGMPVIIPMLGLQNDKKYFEKPDEFYPEHFTKEAISQRPHFAYLPFGEGPRVCIAERFANMMMLMGAIYLIKDFTFEVSPKTTVPLEFAPSSGGASPIKGGIWLKCQPL